ncbi:amidohydrolase [Actinoplanes sp. LDG1-06]|uniref:Amidohydrolase n=1 Tax=Paractinoplanes ovalisporus TaxID=2810368 RepID=A0ABS2AVE7_9ACTN|nr:amidohydrolase [Actinoplanes ovalisporus]MBM2623847.1 amidohydrolase [Actinoplanes ovalisporus]
MTEADLVFADGNVFTGDERGSSWLAVKDGRVLAVGGDELRTYVGGRTEVVELGGRLLIPGFQDAHIHAVMGGVELGQCDLTGTTDVEEYLRRLRRYADDNPGAEWILGGGWSMESFENGIPDRRLLDSVVPDRPVYLLNRDHHAAWVNTVTLERAGITASTPDPASGRIDRESDGTPVGALQEGAMELVDVPDMTDREKYDGLMRAQRLLLSLGITAWQDAMLAASNGYADVSDAYVRAAREGTLIASVVGALWWDRDLGAEQIDELVGKREQLSVGRLRCDTVKMMLDGIAENFTAAMTEPYRDACGHATGNRGLSFIDPGALPAYVTELDRLGFQAHFHALGDRAVRDALDAVEAARAANGTTDTRPHLAHLQVVHPDDVPRFARLGATANMQPYWAAHEPQMDELTIPFLDPAAVGRQYPFGDLRQSGARLAGGSDWPVSTPDPLQGIHVAVNRVLPGEKREAFLPEQRLDLRTALTAYTAGSAYVNRRDDTGSLRPGYRADLTVLDRDLFVHPKEEIGDAKVELTFVDGKRVYG